MLEGLASLEGPMLQLGVGGEKKKIQNFLKSLLTPWSPVIRVVYVVNELKVNS